MERDLVASVLWAMVLCKRTDYTIHFNVIPTPHGATPLERLERVREIWIVEYGVPPPYASAEAAEKSTLVVTLPGCMHVHTAAGCWHFGRFFPF